MPQPCDIGLIGLAVMGENLALNIESRGYRVAVFNRTTSKVDEFIAGRAKGKKFVGCHSLEELVKNLAKPRKVMMMVKAGPAVDDLIETLLPLLSTRATSSSTAATRTSPTPSGARSTSRAKGLLYIGTGVSGGEEGALQRPQHDARRQRRRPGRSSSRSSRRSPPRSARRTTSPAANGSARAAPATT